ncbi:hypothetical protein DFH09DRAFT_1085965 [Mycena vulgaris]|nr:hypothetical protein DFH09DRAFT_1085965 [Mycena vulgaris]
MRFGSVNFLCAEPAPPYFLDEDQYLRCFRGPMGRPLQSWPRYLRNLHTSRPKRTCSYAARGGPSPASPHTVHVALEGIEGRSGLGSAGDGVGGQLLKLGHRRAGIIEAVGERRKEAVVGVTSWMASMRAVICDGVSAIEAISSGDTRERSTPMYFLDFALPCVETKEMMPTICTWRIDPPPYLLASVQHRSQEFVKWKVTSKLSRPE